MSGRGMLVFVVVRLQCTVRCIECYGLRLTLASVQPFNCFNEMYVYVS